MIMDLRARCHDNTSVCVAGRMHVMHAIRARATEESVIDRNLESHLVHLRGTTAEDLSSFPLETRVLDRLTAMLIMADEIAGELETEEWSAILAIEPAVRRLFDDIDSLIRRLAQ
jgi:hypothetical protein